MSRPESASCSENGVVPLQLHNPRELFCGKARGKGTRRAQSTFTTLSRCLLQIGQSTQSILAITNITKSKRGDNITVSISNIANHPIAAQVAVYAPPDFTVINSTRNVTIKQGLTSTPFAISTQTQYTNYEFPVTVAVSYVSGNVHYATVTTISFGSAEGRQGSQTICSFSA